MAVVKEVRRRVRELGLAEVVAKRRRNDLEDFAVEMWVNNCGLWRRIRDAFMVVTGWDTVHWVGVVYPSKVEEGRLCLSTSHDEGGLLLQVLKFWTSYSFRSATPMHISRIKTFLNANFLKPLKKLGVLHWNHRSFYFKTCNKNFTGHGTSRGNNPTRCKFTDDYAGR